jgi:hypothetical protein
MDVKITFLNGNLTLNVYMAQHEGFVDPKILGRYANFKCPSMG